MSKKSRIGTIAAAGAIAGIAFASVAMPANAATGASTTDPEKNAQGQCLASPSHYNAIDHAEKSHQVTTTTSTPYNEEVWGRNVPGEDAVYQQLTKYFQPVPAVEGTFKLYYTIKGHDAVTRKETRYFQYVPGTHTVVQLTKTIPGTPGGTITQYKYSQEITQYRFRSRVERPDNTVERKYINGYDFVDGGTTKVNGKTIAGHWVKSSGWHAIPDVIINAVWGSGGVPSNLLGGSEAHPKGTVNLSVYGGPNANVQYYASLVTIDGGYTDWGPWSDWSTTNPGGDTATRDVQTQTVTQQYNNGNWTTDKPGAPWVQTATQTIPDPAHPGTPDKTVWMAQDGSETDDVNNAGWFPDTSVPAGWTAKNSKQETDPIDDNTPKVFLEQDGSTTSPNPDDAGWFPVSDPAPAGFQTYGDTRDHEIEPATEDKTFYEGRDDQGNLVETTNKDEAVALTSMDGVDTSKDWQQFDVTAAVEAHNLYLTEDENGTFGQSENADEASWIDVTTTVLPVWQQMVDEHGDPLVKDGKIIKDRVPGHEEYYVPNGEPTLQISDDNWIQKDQEPSQEEGWMLIDTRTAHTPPVTETHKVVDAKAWTEQQFVPATYASCVLAFTGSNTNWGPTGLAGLGLGVAGGTMLYLKRRARHRAEGKQVQS